MRSREIKNTAPFAVYHLFKKKKKKKRSRAANDRNDCGVNETGPGDGLLLLGRSLGEEKMQQITDHMRADPVVERFLDQGDGAMRELLHRTFRAAGHDEDPRAMDAALKLYGEEVVTAVGDEVDRIENAIVRIEPSIHYVDLETN